MNIVQLSIQNKLGVEIETPNIIDNIIINFNQKTKKKRQQKLQVFIEKTLPEKLLRTYDEEIKIEIKNRETQQETQTNYNLKNLGSSFYILLFFLFFSY